MDSVGIDSVNGHRVGRRVSARDFYGLFKTSIFLIQPSLCLNSRTHDLMIYKSHDTRTTRQ